MKNNFCLFERPFKIRKNGVFFLKYSGMPVSRTSRGKPNWFKKTGVREIKGGIKLRDSTVSFFVSEILTFSIMQIRSVMTSYCLLLKIVKCWKNHTSRNIKAVFLKLGTKIVHHKRNKMMPLVLLPQQLFRLQSLSVQKTNPPFATS